MSKEVAVKETNAVALPEEFDEFAGLGYESTTAADYSRPFIYLTQPLSPQVEDAGAKMGDYWLTGFNVNLGNNVRFIPVYTKQEYNEWVPRKDGGGFVQSFDVDAIEVEAAKARAVQEHGKTGWINKLMIGKNQLVQTVLLFVLVDAQSMGWVPAVMPLTSTKIKPYTNFRTMLNGVKLPNGKPFPLFAHVCAMKSEKQKNDHGTFAVPLFTFAEANAVESRLSPKNPTFLAAYEFYKALAAGELNIDRSKMATDDRVPSDEEVPF